MCSLNGIGCINGPADIRWAFEFDGQMNLFLRPLFNHNRVRSALPFVQRIKRGFCVRNDFYLINGLQIGRKFLLIFARHVFQAIADLMDHIELDFKLGEGRVGEVGQTVNTGNQNISSP